MSGKVLFYDIESSPNIVLSWRTGYKLSIPPENIVKERAIMCICWKWQGESEVNYLDWGSRQNDKTMLRKFSKILNSADLVVGHNADKFDYAYINGRLAFHGLPALNPQASIDTLKQSRRSFYLNSHKLDYLGKFLGVGKKVSTGGFELWANILLRKCDKSLDKMVTYCKNDVVLLEKVYDRIKPYVKQTIHQGILHGEDELSCKACGSVKTKWNGARVAYKIMYRARRCNSCGHFWRTNVRIK